jgi:hypothetical protein
MFTNLLKWLKPEIIQETEESVLLKHALENNEVEIEENDIVLFDRGLAGIGPAGQRQEALIHDYTNEDAQVIYLNKGVKKTRWIPLYSITSNLGDEYWSEEQLLSMGLTDPKPQRAPNKPLVSGTYISEIDEDEYALVEIEKVNGQYYIHNVSDAHCLPIDQDHEYDLLEFSAPEEGTYILDPGLYIRTDKRLFEVVPFKGKCWTRQLDDCMLNELDEHEALKLTRVETDELTPSFYIPNFPEDEEPTEFDPHLEPYKVPEPNKAPEPNKCGCYGCAGEINTPEINPTDPI